jgi:two-component system sensor histidine kinase RpfC
MSALSALMLMTDGSHVPLFVFYLWVTLGNGFRYKLSYLWISYVVSIAGFYIAITWGEYWQQNEAIALSLLAILVVLPVYASFLLKKLHAAIAEAERANRAKSRFLANMSHELRTPLNGVIGMGELLRETQLSFEQHELVSSMHTSAQTLLDLIENVLDISKIEAGKLAIEHAPFDLHQLVNSVRHMLAPMGEVKGLSITCHIDPDIPYSLIGDAPHIRQVIINLLNNAIKFTEEGSVTLSVLMLNDDRDRPQLRFEVRDTGIGISEQAQQTIFDDFTQAETGTRRRYGGTGLGTAIARNLVELMGGRIGVRSRPGLGSTFWFELTFDRAETEPEALAHHHVLLLASEASAQALRPTLRGWDIAFEWARSAPRALSLLRNAAMEGRPYDTLLLDPSVLIDVTAVQFAEMIREEDDLEALSLVLINASQARMEVNRIRQFFVAMLDSAEDKRLLFNALHAAQSLHFKESNVVPLAEHYARLGDGRSLDILVVEDNAVNQQVLTGILEHAGHTVKLAVSGDEALDILADELDRLDLVVLDMNMPGRSGIDVIKALRFMDTTASLPVIMLTADSTLDARECSLAAGVDSFLTKPVDAHLLIEEVVRLSHSKPRVALTEQPEMATPAMIESIAASPWFDDEQLRQLADLGGGLGFLRQLVKGFRTDGRRHLRELRVACDADFPAFRDNLHALKGSATELGATTLVTLCQTGESLKPYDLDSERMWRLIQELEEAFAQTLLALEQAASDPIKDSQPGADR